MNALTFEIWLQQPTLVAQIQAGDENSRSSQLFIPGSTLRGALIQHYNQDALTLGAEGERLFLSGDVQFLNAYPLTSGGKRSLPIPHSLFRDEEAEDKDKEDKKVYDLSISDKVLTKPKRLEENTCLVDNAAEKLKIYRTKKQSIAHNASTERMVKQKNDSTVFRYEALAAGQVFGAVIWAKNDQDLSTLEKLLKDNPICMIGRTRSAGYGAVRFQNIKIEQNWCEFDHTDDDDDKPVVVTLLSDAILINPNTGQADTTLQSLIGNANPLKAFRSVHVVGGFNRTAGFPLPQALAITAGSVFVFAKSDLPKTIYQQWLETGIGERRAEGFGRVAINWLAQPEFWYENGLAKAKKGSPELSPASAKLAKQMATRMLRAELEKRMLEALSKFKFTAPPQNAQLSRLRVVTRSAWRNNNIGEITEHLKDLKHGARAQIDRCRVGFGENAGLRLSFWLKDHLKDDQLWRDFLQPTKLPKVAEQEAIVDAALKLEYCARFLDAMFKKMSKSDLDEAKQQKDGIGVAP